MKSKKLISLLCAAAMSASAFAGLTVTASAATDLVTLDGSTASGWVAPDGADKGDIVPTVTTDDGETDQYLKFQGSGGGNRKSTYSLGQTISGQYTIEYDTMMTRGNGMSRIMHSNQLAFTNDTSTKDTRDGAGIIDTVNAQQGTKYNSGSGASVANAAMKTDLRPYLTDKWIINDDSTSELVAYPEGAVEVADTKWVRVQAAVNNDKTTVTVIDKSGNKLVDGVEYTNSTNEINSIYVCSNRGDGGSGIVALDNLHIYQGAPETLTTDGLRGDATVVVPTVMPVPDVKTQAPGLSAPDGVTPVVNNTFSKALASTAMGETATTITDVDGLSIAMGNRTGGDTATTVSVEDWARGDKVLTLAGGPYSGAGRGPVVSAANTLALADGKSSVMTFAVNLGSNKAGGAGRLYILKDNSQAGSDKNGAYNNVMGVLTTDDTASSYTIGSGSNVITIGQQVEAYQWYKVAIIVSSDKFRIWVAKADEDFTEKPQVDCDHVGTGDTASSVSELPLLAVTSEKGGSYTGSVARIDNMLTYSGTADQPRKLLPTTQAAPTPAPIPAKVTMSVDETANTVTLTSDKDTDAVLVQASYRTDKTLDSVKKVVNLKLEANKATTVPATDLDAFTTNDKIMVWDSLKTMTPLAGVYTVKNGAAQATAKPAPTAEPTETPAETVAPTAEPSEAPAETPATTVAPTAEPTEAPAETAAPTAEPTEAPAETPAPTDTPAPTATAVPTYAVSGTVDAGVKSVTLTDKAEAENTITGTIEDTAVTFTGVKAGTYTVSAVAKDDYKDLTVTPQEITVSGNLAGVFTVTTTAKVKSAVTTTVTGGTATVTGATDLKSVAEGTELTITAATPALGYLATNPTITVTKTDDADTTVAVAEGKFTMPAYPVTVTVAYAADPTVTVATLNHTAHSQWGSNTPAEGTTDNELERFNWDVDTGWAAVAYMDFDISNIDVNTLYSAELTYKATSAKTYPSAMYYLTGDVDLTTGITGAAADRFADSRKVVNAAIPSVKGGVTLNQDVLAAVVARKADSKANVIFALTGNNGGADLYGKASTDAPTLVAKKGVPVTFTVTAGEDEKVAGAEISVKSGNDVVKTAKTDENGTATIVLLPSTEYTYTVTSSSYAIKKDVAFTTTTESSAVKVALTDNVATTVEITSPENNIVVVGSPITFTATVKDQDGRAMTGKTVNWTVVDTPANIAVENGVVSVTNGVVGGKYKVQATIADTEISATADFEVVAKSKGTLKAIYTTGDETTGVVETVDVYTEDDNKFETDEVTVPESYLSERVVTNSDTGLYDVYSYVSGGTDKITLAAGENKVVIVVKKDASYNVYEKFEDEKPLFKADSRITVKIEDDATLNSKVVGFTCASNAGNGYSFAHYALPDTVTKDIVTFDFDYYNTNGGRAILSIGDATTRGTTGGSTKVTYNSTGAIFNLGSTKTNALVQGDSSKTIGDYTNKWMHVNVVVNQSTKKVSYTITNKADGAEIAKATDVAFVDATTENLKATQIDIFGYINNSHCAMLDNIKVTESDAATSATE